MQSIQVKFDHGLGDCTYFAHQLELYVARGFEVELHTPARKRFVFEGCSNVRIYEDHSEYSRHSWIRGPGLKSVTPQEYYLANKAGCNFSRSPMPNIGLLDSEIWEEFCEVKLPLLQKVPAEAKERVEKWFASMPRPVILLHTKGNALSAAKDLDEASTLELYRHLLDETEGTLVLLDWHNRAPALKHARVRDMLQEFGAADLPELLSMIDQADLLVGIDSGPSHFARFTETPVLTVWYKHHPGVYALPRNNHVHLVTKKRWEGLNCDLRGAYHLINCAGERVSGKEVGRQACRMLDGATYLGNDQLGADIQLQHYIRDLVRGGITPQRSYADRHRSFDIMVRHLAGLKRPFKMLETGTVRMLEDWKGAGYSTYLFGHLAMHTVGRVISVDIEPANCHFARLATAPFEKVVEIRNQDSVAALQAEEGGLDLLYLDSLDTGDPNSSSHALKEAQAGASKVALGGLLAIDDTPCSNGSFLGKGKKAIPWLLSQGFELVFSGHQALLRKVH